METLEYGEETNRITEEDVRKATETLQKYKQGKAQLENRIIADQQWYKMRHWDLLKAEDDGRTPKATSAWLFNNIINKHADAMDNYPLPAILPREKSDEETARILSAVLPVILENNHFNDTYSLCWWDKLVQGMGGYGIFWNKNKENGLGDIDIRQLDMLNIFWEPGITHIQDSRELFITQLVDKDILKSEYPDLEGLEGNAIDVSHYIYDDTVDTTDKVVVVDWYYKKRNILHYCKFVNDKVLYASENDPKCRDTGLYEHGLYPIVIDVMYPEKGTPVGFGLVSIDKDPQLFVDSLASNLLESSMMGSKKRFIIGRNTSINEDEFCDWTKPFIHVDGAIDDQYIREFDLTPPSAIYTDLMNQKIQEMKETSGNRDMNQGGTAAGVTAASAIAALQEAGNKTSRDMINTSYRAYNEITAMVVELIRQFYDEARTFRIMGENNEYEYATLSNAPMKEQTVGFTPGGERLVRKPIFDYKMKAQKQSPFSRMEENERAKELYGLGFFNPERAQEALIALEMMDFEGVEGIREKIAQGQTLLNQLNQAQQQIQMLQAQAQTMTMQLRSMGAPTPPAPPMGQPAPHPPQETHMPQELAGNHKNMADQIMASRVPQKPYAKKLLDRSRMEQK